MLRITISNTAKEELWTLQGRLVEPGVAQLKACWQQHDTAEGRRRVVNLDDVTFIDSSGERLLRQLANQGAQCVAGDVYVQHVLDRLRGKRK